MSEQQKDTAPFVTSRRITRHIRIQQVNDPPSPNVFDVTVEYLSTDLPEWFAGLQSIVEDETFTSLDITLGSGKTRYLITIAGDIDVSQEQESVQLASGTCLECERDVTQLTANGYCEGCVMQAAIEREYRIALREGGYYACFPEKE